ncbi:hypothetical protein PUN4_620070 [Paraburkholderia unamae]|nr:hypothetical protein PUN4_620070 [Paraburkholderia unamae]
MMRARDARSARQDYGVLWGSNRGAEDRYETGVGILFLAMRASRSGAFRFAFRFCLSPLFASFCRCICRGIFQGRGAFDTTDASADRYARNRTL